MDQHKRNREEACGELQAKLEHRSAQADLGVFVDPDDVLRRIEDLKRKRAADKAS